MKIREDTQRLKANGLSFNFFIKQDRQILRPKIYLNNPYLMG